MKKKIDLIEKAFAQETQDIVEERCEIFKKRQANYYALTVLNKQQETSEPATIKISECRIIGRNK
jgi:hypothetical protein